MTDESASLSYRHARVVADHRKQEHRVALKLGKLQVVAAKPAPGLTAADRERLAQRCAGYERALDHGKQENRGLHRQCGRRIRRTVIDDASRGP